MIADRTLCLDRSQTTLVEDGSLASKWVLVSKGQAVPPEEIKRLDLRVWSDGRVMQGPEPEVVVPAEPLADVVQPAGAMEEPKPKRTYTPRRKG